MVAGTGGNMSKFLNIRHLVHHLQFKPFIPSVSVVVTHPSSVSLGRELKPGLAFPQSNQLRYALLVNLHGRESVKLILFQMAIILHLSLRRTNQSVHLLLLAVVLTERGILMFHEDFCSICGKLCLHPYSPGEIEEHIKMSQLLNI